MDTMIIRRRRNLAAKLRQGAVKTYDFTRDDITSEVSFGHIGEQINYTCASALLVPDIAGNYQSFSANHTAITNAGLHIQPSVINLMKSSNNFAASNWDKYGTALITPNVAIAPDGSMAANRITNIPAIGEFTLQYSSISPSNTYTGHMYFKGEGADIGKTLSLKLNSASGVAIEAATLFTLTAQWQRVEVSVDFLADNNNAKLQIYKGNSETANACLVWNGQLELGSFASNPIITPENSTGTSAATVLFDDVSEFSLSQASLFFEFSYLNRPSDYPQIANITGNNDALRIFLDPNDDLAIQYSANSQVKYFATVTDFPKGQNKIALTWNNDVIKFYGNGALAGSLDVSTYPLPLSLNNISFGASSTGQSQTCLIAQKAVLYDNALTETQAVELTT